MSENWNRNDPELTSLLGDDPELLSTARRLRESRPQPVLDPRFKAVLRAQLMREAETVLAPTRRRWFAPRVGHLAWGSGAIGLALVAAVILVLRTPTGPDQLNVITASSPLAEQHQVSPSDVITVSFSQPMNTQAVQQGLRMNPAAKVTLSWSDHNKTLAIHPAHPLAANTSYAVTIARDQAQSASGQKASGDIKITFGTKATPPASPAATPTPGPALLQPVTLGPVDSGSAVFFAPGGEPGSTSSAATTSNSGGTSTLAPASPAATATPGSAPASQVVLFPKGASPQSLGAASTAVAFSPSGLAATAVPRADGGSDITVVDSHGTRSILVSTTDRQHALAWDDSSVVYVDQGAIRSVGLGQRSRQRFDAAGATVVLAPDGRHAVIIPAASSGASAGASPSATPAGQTATALPDATLVDLRTQTQRPLAGSGAGQVMFSGDGATVAWISGSSPRSVMESQTATNTSHALPQVANLGDHLSLVALSHDGGLIAYANQSHLTVARADGSVVGVDHATAAVAFAPDSSQVAYVENGSTGPVLVEAAVPGITKVKPPVGVPADAHQVLAAFVEAQVEHNTDALTQLSSADAGALTQTPSRLSRGYVISESLNPNNSVSATARLILDPGDGTSDPKLSDETLKVARVDTSYRVIEVTAPRLQTESAGPHVLRVQTTETAAGALLSITFDADLQPETVAGALTLLAANHNALPGIDTHYNADTRTATVLLPSGPGDAFTVHIDTSLTDVNGVALSAPYETRVTA